MKAAQQRESFQFGCDSTSLYLEVKIYGIFSHRTSSTISGEQLRKGAEKRIIWESGLPKPSQLMTFKEVSHTWH